MSTMTTSELSPRAKLAYAHFCALFPRQAIFLYRAHTWDKLAPMDISGRYRRFGIVPSDTKYLHRLDLAPEIMDDLTFHLTDEEFDIFLKHWENRLNLRMELLDEDMDMIDVETLIDNNLALFAVYPAAVMAVLEGTHDVYPE